MDLLNSLPTGPKVPDIVNVIIEIARNSQNKYEYDEKYNIIKLDRVLGSHLSYPANYGFVPRAWSRDNDPLDALVLTHEPVEPGILIEGRVIGLLKMIDKGKQDNKLLCVAQCDPKFEDVNNLSGVSRGTLNAIAQFFEVYKKTEGIETIVHGWEDAAVAKKEVKYCMELYKKVRGGKGKLVGRKKKK